MGGEYFDRDVGSSSSSSSGWGVSSSINYSSQADKLFNSNIVDETMIPINKSNKKLKAKKKHLVGIIIDGTGSMGDDIKVLFDKMPRAYGKIKELLNDVEFIVGVVGDANCGMEKAPIQITDIIENEIKVIDEKKVNTFDLELVKLQPEYGGGGQGCESYELMAYYILKYVDISLCDDAFLIFIGDEDYYKTINPYQIKKFIGDDEKTINTIEIFNRLERKFKGNVFNIHRKYNSWNDDKDNEIVTSWKKALLPEHVLLLDDAKAIVDVLIGVVGIVTRKRDLDSYAIVLKDDEQTSKRIDDVKKALNKLNESVALTVVSDVDLVPIGNKTKTVKRL